MYSVMIKSEFVLQLSRAVQSLVYYTANDKLVYETILT